MHGIEPPPAWFWDVYDAIQLGVPYYDARSLRQVPVYIRYRMRMVKEVLKEVQFERAKRAKAMGVIDLSNV